MSSKKGKLDGSAEPRAPGVSGPAWSRGVAEPWGHLAPDLQMGEQLVNVLLIHINGQSLANLQKHIVLS